MISEKTSIYEIRKKRPYKNTRMAENSARLTIDNLSAAASQQFAADAAVREANQKFFDEVRGASTSTAPGVAVLTRATESQLSALTGTLGQNPLLSMMKAPSNANLSNIFTYVLFTGYQEKDKAQILQNLDTLKASIDPTQSEAVTAIQSAVNLLSTLSGWASMVYAACRQFKQG